MENKSSTKEEVFIETEKQSLSSSEAKFEAFIELLQELLMSDKFEENVSSFVEKHCETFEDTEENKFEYTDIFNQYCTTIESLIEEEIREKMPQSSSAELLSLIPERQDSIDEEVMDTLLSFSDFAEFKKMMIETKKGKNMGLELNIVKLD